MKELMIYMKYRTAAVRPFFCYGHTRHSLGELHFFPGETYSSQFENWLYRASNEEGGDGGGDMEDSPVPTEGQDIDVRAPVLATVSSYPTAGKGKGGIGASIGSGSMPLQSDKGGIDPSTSSGSTPLQSDKGGIDFMPCDCD